MLEGVSELSPREKQCLDLLSTGKGEAEVALLLGIRKCTAHTSTRRSAREGGYQSAELSRLLKRPYTYISKIEADERRLDVIELIEIARVLKIEPAKLFAEVIQATGL